LPPRCFDSRDPAQPASTPTLWGYGGSSPTRAARGRSRTERFAGDRLQAGGDDDPHENHPEADPGVAAQTEEAEHGVGAEQLHREPEHPVSDQVESQQLPPNGRKATFG